MFARSRHGKQRSSDSKAEVSNTHSACATGLMVAPIIAGLQLSFFKPRYVSVSSGLPFFKSAWAKDTMSITGLPILVSY